METYLIPYIDKEEIDNPRMRGRKLLFHNYSFFLLVEEIDNPRMRGRQCHFPS